MESRLNSALGKMVTRGLRFGLFSLVGALVGCQQLQPPSSYAVRMGQARSQASNFGTQSTNGSGSNTYTPSVTQRAELLTDIEGGRAEGESLPPEDHAEP